jgi:hypothetical protein
VSAVAFDTPLAFEHRLRTVPPQAEPGWVGETVEERKPAANGDIKPWELHSELVLVCPEVCNRARELLPARDPDAFLAKTRKPARPTTRDAEAQNPPHILLALTEYTFWRLLETARTALLAFGGTVVLALLVEALN